MISQNKDKWLKINASKFDLREMNKSVTIKISRIRRINMQNKEGFEFEIDVIKRLTKIETLLEDFKGLETRVNNAYNLSLNNKSRLDKIEDNNKWLLRTTWGAVITGLVAIVLSFIK